MIGWGGLPVILSGLLALLLLSSAVSIARRERAPERDAILRILASGGLVAMFLFGLSVIVQLFSEAVVALGGG